ncbi:DNA polymerase alpha/epsilon subunit B-domain-containing protein [Tribonema minus]|uniref:DNA polymerase alpha subunit B n=1 Tax=Tribonema minus TaxID=303371 RepID=A0A836CA88_9STRA|nr:DNA polymerase alpha/epsilon subunit B-domain-containing protein [Tribonema minus]
MAAVSSTEVLQAFKSRVQKAELTALESQPDLLESCVSLCTRFSLKVDDLANEWEAYACNDQAAKLSSAGLAQLTALLAKRSASSSSARKPPQPSSAPRRLVTARPTVSPPLLTKESAARALATPVPSHLKRPLPGLMSPPGSTVNKAARTGAGGFSSPAPSLSVQQTPVAARSGGGGGGGSAGSAGAAHMPQAAYADRANAGARVLEYNPSKLMHAGAIAAAAAAAPPPQQRQRCSVEPICGVGAAARYRYMFAPLEERSRLQEAALLAATAELARAHALGELTPVGVPRQEEVTVVGRVVCESGEGRMGRASALLEGSWRDSGGARAALALDALPSFALFPGQIVAARGINSGGMRMAVRGLLPGSPAPPAASPPAALLAAQRDDAPVTVVVAAGPYTTDDNLEYEPLNDLLAHVQETRPDVVVLMGPFVDAEHPLIAAGAAALPVPGGDGGGGGGDAAEPVDFETLFRLRVCDKLERVLADPAHPTQFVLIPSTRDAFHDATYPQPPFADAVAGGAPLGIGEYADDAVYTLGLPRDARVACLPNPAAFAVGGAVFAATSADSLFDLSCEEAAGGAGGAPRLARLADHLLQQRSFYPLRPARAGVPLDPRRAAALALAPRGAAPDVLLLPGRLAQFARDVRGCVCVNPGALTRGGGGGTYAALALHPLPRAELEAAARDAPDIAVPHGVAQRTALEVRRI